MANPEYQKAIIFLQRASALNNGNALVYNEAPAMDGGVPIKMSSGASTPNQYGPTTSDVNNPTYAPGWHTTTRSTATFNNLRLFNPNYDVVDLIVGANWNPAGGNTGRIESGLKILCEEDDQARSFARFSAGATPDASAVQIISLRENPSPDSTHYASAGLFSNTLSSETTAGFGGSTVTLTTISDFAYGGVVGIGTTGSQGGLSSQFSWRPWAGLGISSPTTGVPQWIATRYHKYDPAFPGQCKISVVSSWDSTVRTVTFTAFGSLAGIGLPVNSIQNLNYNLIGRMTLAYDIASEATTWNSAVSDQATLWINTTENKSITQYFSQLRGGYKRNTGAIVDQTTATYYDLQGQIVNGREVLLTLPSGPTDLSVVGGFPSDSGSQAGIWLISPNGSVRVPQYIRNWGRGSSILNYLGRTTAGANANLSGTIRFVITQGSLSDLRGCSFEVRDVSGNIVLTVPISKVSFNGEVASANSTASTMSGSLVYFPGKGMGVVT